jgi:hypothetical protein
VLSAALVASAAAGVFMPDIEAEDRPKLGGRGAQMIDSLRVSRDGATVAALVWQKDGGVLRIFHPGNPTEQTIPVEVNHGAIAFVDHDTELLFIGFDSVRSAVVSHLFRVRDGVDLFHPKDGRTSGKLATIAGLWLTPSSDGEHLLIVAKDGRSIDVRRSDTGESTATVAVPEAVAGICATSSDGDFLVKMRDGTFARVAGADGKILWHGEPPRRGDDTTPSPGEAAPARPDARASDAWVTPDGARVVVEWTEKEDYGRGLWEQRIVVAYDWKDDREVWRRRPKDQDMDETFFAAKRGLVGMVHGSRATLLRAADGEPAGTLDLDGPVDSITCGAESDVGWATTFGGALFSVDLAEMKSK